jgi:hypothetical protein
MDGKAGGLSKGLARSSSSRCAGGCRGDEQPMAELDPEAIGPVRGRPDRTALLASTPELPYVQRPPLRQRQLAHQCLQSQIVSDPLRDDLTAIAEPVDELSFTAAQATTRSPAPCTPRFTYPVRLPGSRAKGRLLLPARPTM